MKPFVGGLTQEAAADLLAVFPFSCRKAGGDGHVTILAPRHQREDDYH